MMTLFVLMFMAASAVASADERRDEKPDDCLPEGESTAQCVEIVLNKRTTMTANIKEWDVAFDDEMGDATISHVAKGLFKICAVVTNDGGVLSGPNGVPQNDGWVEGDCIETYLEIQLTSPVSVGASGMSFGANGSFSWTISFESSPTTICPCS